MSEYLETASQQHQVKPSLIMDASKKKMQAMKIEKDNAMDRADTCEQARKEAKRRATKAEEEHADLSKKASQVES